MNAFPRAVRTAQRAPTDPNLGLAQFLAGSHDGLEELIYDYLFSADFVKQILAGLVGPFGTPLTATWPDALLQLTLTYGLEPLVWDLVLTPANSELDLDCQMLIRSALAPGLETEFQNSSLAPPPRHLASRAEVISWLCREFSALKRPGMVAWLLRREDPTLTGEQVDVVARILSGENVFLTGSAGTGKTYALRRALDFLQRWNRSFAVTGMTGISAHLLGGVTLHSFLGIGLGDKTEAQILSTLKRYNRGTLRKWVETELLIVDEISLMSGDLLAKIESLARKIRGQARPFGGLQVVFCGDFCQLPPIGNRPVPTGTGGTVERNLFAFEAPCWRRIIPKKAVCCLREPMRYSSSNQGVNSNHETFVGVLNQLRLGRVDAQVRAVLDARIGVELQLPVGLEPSQLYTHNRDIDRINQSRLDSLARETGAELLDFGLRVQTWRKVTEKTVRPGSSAEPSEPDKPRVKVRFEPTVHLNSDPEILKRAVFPPVVTLCVGAQVMLTVNLDLEKGLVNGSRGVVVGFEGRAENPVVRFLTGPDRVERRIQIEPYPRALEISVLFSRLQSVGGYRPLEDEFTDFKCEFSQIPLALAWATSVHKTQGATLDAVEVSLRNAFDFGQVYVALSRARSLEALSILDLDYSKIRADPRVLQFYADLERPSSEAPEKAVPGSGPSPPGLVKIP